MVFFKVLNNTFMRALYVIFFMFLFTGFAVDAQFDASSAHTVNIAATLDTLIIENDSLAITPEEKIISAEEAIKVKEKALFGIASFYHKSLEGTKTATGEIFRHAKLTAASNNYKLNTWVKVTNVKTGKYVVVRINDRMHPGMAKKGRVVDLSSTAALKIGITSKVGIAKVKVEELVEAPPVPDKKTVASR